MIGRFALGLDAVLPPDHAFLRDEILAHLVGAIVDETNESRYEARELLSSELPLASDDGEQQGELLVMMRSDNVGGPLPRAQADAVIARADAIGRQGELELPRQLYRPRTVICPPACTMGPIFVPETHPLWGARKMDVADALEIVRGVETQVDPSELARFRALLALCLGERLVMTFTY